MPLRKKASRISDYLNGGKMGGSNKNDFGMATQPADFDLTCWYVNLRRVMEVVGPEKFMPGLRAIGAIENIEDSLRRNAVVAALEKEFLSWMQTVKLPSLGQLLLSGEPKAGSFFTHYSNFFFKGLSQVSKAIENGKKPIPMAVGYAKLDELGDGRKLEFQFSHEHLTSNSAWCELTGQKRLLLVGAVKNATAKSIEAIPWIVANPMPDLFQKHTVIGSHWQSRLEIFIDGIDNFERVRDQKPLHSSRDLDVMKTIPESEIKKAFAEIINEPVVPKDWGGERSDLFTTNVQLQGERIATAFAFKGPAQFHPMTVADLGKNGDQIDRLFSEPAELLILQHCHQIQPPVRGMMRAYAQQLGRLRLFCLIDGFDTLRLLKAYSKCGFSAQ